MNNPSSADWDRLRALCRRAHLAPERVDHLERAWSASSEASPLTLVAGSPGTLALFLARWLGKDAASALSNGSPLVVGPKPETIQPAVGQWAGIVRQELAPRHVLAVASEGPLNASLRAALESLGTAADQALIISRLSQPLSVEERRLAASLAPLAATSRVVFMALPSEEGTESERAGLAAYGVAQLQDNGFHGRCLGAGVWYTDGNRPADTIQHVEDWLVARPDDISSGRRAATGIAMARLLTEIEKAPDQPPEADLSVEEVDDVTRKFAQHVAVLGRRLCELSAIGEFRDSASCRQFMVESMQGWLNRASLEGMLLDYVENVRPGIKAELPAQVTAAAELLRFEPGPSPDARRLSSGSAGRLRQLTCGLIAGAITFALIDFFSSAFLKDWFRNVVASVAGTAAAFAAFAIGDRWMPSSGQRSRTDEPSLPSTIPGWSSAELRLTNWFNGRVRTQAPTLREECAAVRSKFQLEGDHP